MEKRKATLTKLMGTAAASLKCTDAAVAGPTPDDRKFESDGSVLVSTAPANTGDAGRRRVDGAQGGPPLLACTPPRHGRASAWPYGALIEVGGLASAARRIRKQSQASPGAPGQEPSLKSPY